MKKKFYKIGRYLYKEVSEKRFLEIGGVIQNTPYEYTTLFMLIDVDGEPIKFFKRIKNKNDK